jgi:transcriptional regulator with XRE-family HTH domain
MVEEEPGPVGPSTGLSATAKLGRRLRSVREARAISLRELARRLSLSPSAVSQIERGHVMPSVGTLYAMTSELGVRMDEVLVEESLPRADAANDDRFAAGGGAPALAPPATHVFRHGSRTAITLATGVRWELLTSYEPGVEFLHVVYPPGSESCERAFPIRHEGSERGVVLHGCLGVTLGAEDHELAPGDSIAFRSDVPHRLWAIGDAAAEAIWFIVGRNGGGR